MQTQTHFWSRNAHTILLLTVLAVLALLTLRYEYNAITRLLACVGNVLNQKPVPIVGETVEGAIDGCIEQLVLRINTHHKI